MKKKRKGKGGRKQNNRANIGRKGVGNGKEKTDGGRKKRKGRE